MELPGGRVRGFFGTLRSRWPGDELVPDPLGHEAQLPAVVPLHLDRAEVVDLPDRAESSRGIPLTQNSALLFSAGANRRLKHKIIVDSPARTPENHSLGITFRTSKTFVRFRGGQACFPDGVPLTLADAAQWHEFYYLRRRENRETDFTYPRLTYTLSESDLIPPEPGEGSAHPPS